MNCGCTKPVQRTVKLVPPTAGEGPFVPQLKLMVALVCKSAGGPVKGLVPEVVEQKLREKLELAYKFHDEMHKITAVPGGKEKKRKKKS